MGIKMGLLQNITNAFVIRSREILGENLAGIYLHGSAVMGCFNEKKSDIDLLVVVHTNLSNETKCQYMDMVVELNAHAPKKGIEMSVVRKAVCKPFVYPTPFELHFSVMHLQWYRTNPSDYIEKMQGVDKDLAAHFTILSCRGRCLYGEEIEAVFGKVSEVFYFDSIWSDIESAEQEILSNPTYFILNLCRVLAYRREGIILSKQEGGKWGIEHVPKKYHALIKQALDDYCADESEPAVPDKMLAYEYAAYMTGQIKSGDMGKQEKQP